MVAIAQLAEHRIVVPSVVGSSPTSHPKKRRFKASFLFYIKYISTLKYIRLSIYSLSIDYLFISCVFQLVLGFPPMLVLRKEQGWCKQ